MSSPISSVPLPPGPSADWYLSISRSTSSLTLSSESTSVVIIHLDPSVLKAEERIRKIFNSVKLMSATGGAVGGGILSMDPAKLILGSIFSAISNSASTYFALDRGESARIALVEKNRASFERALGMKTHPLPRNYRTLAKNVCRLVSAGAVTYGGSMLMHPTLIAAAGKTTMVVTSSIVQGIGNGMSTYLFWDTGSLDKIKNLQQRTIEIIDQLKPWLIEADELIEIQHKLKAFVLIQPMKTNVKSVAIAGGLTSLGTLCSLDSSDAMGYLGSCISGAGNGASTYLSWDTGEGALLELLERSIPILNKAFTQYDGLRKQQIKIDALV